VTEKMVSKYVNIVFPAYACTNICFGQYVQADEQLMLFVLSKNIKHLQKMCGILCRPSGENDYEGVNESWIKIIKRHFDTVDYYLTLEFFLNAREQMQRRFPKLFPNAKADEKGTELTYQDVKKQREAYDRKVVQYAERPSDKAAQWQTNAWTVLEFIETDIVTAINLKEQQNKWEKSQNTRATSRR
jgi:hypothetical protein